MPSQALVFQLFEPESSTYTYLVYDPGRLEGVLIDPVLEKVDRDLQLVKDLDLKLKYVLDTHIHADHITGADEIRRRTQARTALSRNAKVSCADVQLDDGDILQIGEFEIKAIATPGHTDSCMCFHTAGMLFSGDTLLIRGTGRTDFQQGSADQLYDNIHQKLFTLPESTFVYPAHDYKGQTRSTIGLEKKLNPRLGGGKTKADFKKIMSELKLAEPKKIHQALPANLACGRVGALS